MGIAESAIFMVKWLGSIAGNIVSIISTSRPNFVGISFMFVSCVTCTCHLSPVTTMHSRLVRQERHFCLWKLFSLPKKPKLNSKKQKEHPNLHKNMASWFCNFSDTSVFKIMGI